MVKYLINFELLYLIINNYVIVMYVITRVDCISILAFAKLTYSPLLYLMVNYMRIIIQKRSDRNLKFSALKLYF